MEVEHVFETGAEMRRACARSEFALWSWVVDTHAARVAAIDRSDFLPLAKQLSVQSVKLDLAQALGVAEGRVWMILNAAESIQSRTPMVWDAFRAGDLDAARVSAIANTVDRLATERAWRAVEHTAPDYAATHTLGELRAWLRRLRAKLEPKETEAETAEALEDRRVTISHNDDGTSWLSTLLSTGAAIAIAARLRKAAKALSTVDPETGETDSRTREQKQADLLAHWLTNCAGTSTEIRAEIAISIPVTDLIGYTDGPGITLAEGEPVPAEWVRELAASEHAVLRRIVLDERGDVLDVSTLTYRPSPQLRQAIRWRDGSCRVIGCRAPAHEADQDHELAYDRGGTTSAKNLRCLCRRHHNMKSHGQLADRHIDTPRQHAETYRTAAASASDS